MPDTSRRPRTNADRVLTVTVGGLVASPQFPDVSASPYWPDRDGAAQLLPRVGGIVYNVRMGDSAYSWAGDVIQPGVSLHHPEAGAHQALKIMASIGNRAVVHSGAAKGAEGVVVGKTGRFADHVVVHFPQEALEKLAIGDAVTIYARGRGLAFPDYPQVYVKSIDPDLLERIDVREENGRLSFPVRAVVPPILAGAGAGLSSEGGSICIQSTSPELLSEHGLHDLRLGDLVALQDYDSRYDYGYYEGSMSIGVVVHTDSPRGGYGPGLTVFLTSVGGDVVPRIEETGVNLVELLNLR